MNLIINPSGEIRPAPYIVDSKERRFTAKCGSDRVCFQ